MFRSISPERLLDELADRIARIDAPAPVRVAVDGAFDATDPGALADALIDPLRVRGRPVMRVSAWDFLRPASLRFERGREDPDARYQDWLDIGALRREVLLPLESGGTRLVLPVLWDTARDRAFRLSRRQMPDRGVLLVDGEFLLGRGLAFDLTVHLWASPAALRRRLPEDAQWALPAYHRYEREVRPGDHADVTIRVDHPGRPAVGFR